MATEAQVTANRRNAAKSTGPRTRQGKAVVAMNALKHGLCARQDVVLGEDPQEFERYRAGLLDDLSPLGDAECVLAQRFVGLSWRLRRAERLQNEVFDALLAKELAESMEDFPDELTPEDEQELMSDPSADPRLAIGRMIARDFAYERSLERLLTYERWIENCLYKTTRELRQFQRERKAEAGHGPSSPANLENDGWQRQAQPAELADGVGPHPEAIGKHALADATRATVTDSAKQSQMAGQEPLECGMRNAECGVKAESAKQSQIPQEVPCETKPIEAGGSAGREASQETPHGVTTNGTDSAKQSQSAAETMVGTAHPTSGTDSAKQSQLRGSATGAGALPRCVRRAAWHSHGVPRSY